MMDLIRSTGPFGPVICILILLNLGLVGWTLLRLFGSGAEAGSALRGRINAVLFWGAIGAGVGLLGQANGLYLASQAIANAPAISPQIIIQGVGISFISTIMGLVFLLVSAMAWFALRTLHGRRMGGAAA